MLHRLLVICAFIAASAAFSTADAAVPIPCLATRFLAAEPVPGVADANGKPIVPYYNVFGCQDGKWDGYRSADGTYNKLTPKILAALPAAPGFWTAARRHMTKFWVEWLWVVVGSLAAVGFALATLANFLVALEKPGHAIRR